MSGQFVLGVTRLLTGMVSAVECPAADIIATERALEPILWTRLLAF